MGQRRHRPQIRRERTQAIEQEKNWGTMKHQEEWEKDCYQNDARWECCPSGHKEVWICRKKERHVEDDDPMASAGVSPALGSEQEGRMSCQAKDGSSLVNFGEYNDWAYADILKDNPKDAAYICMESKDSSESHRQFQEWDTLKEYESQPERRPNHQW